MKSFVVPWKTSWLLLLLSSLVVSSNAHKSSRRTSHRVDIQHSVTNINGIELFVQESTSGRCQNSSTKSKYSKKETRGKNVPVLLIHGLTYSSHEFDVEYESYSLVDSLLKDNGCRSVWLMDVAGYGRSGDVPVGLDISSDAAAVDLEIVVEYIRQQQQNSVGAATNTAVVDLVGWSWGTVTIARMVTRQPTWIRKIVLYAPLIRAFDGDPNSLSDFHENTWTHAASDFQLDAAGEIDYDIAEPGAVHQFLSNCWRCDENASPNGGRFDLIEGSDVVLIEITEDFPPTLMIGGSLDPLLYFDSIQEAFDQLPHPDESELVILEGAGHILMLEKDYHREFQRQINRFLQ